MKIMASIPITSWQIDGETIETVRDFIFWGSKITADGDCSHEIKRCFLLGRKAITNLDSIFKSRDISLPIKISIIKAVVFPIVMYGCEIWTIKKAEYQRIDAFELWHWRRLLRVSWTARWSNQPILKKISPEYSLEEMILKLQYFGHLMRRADSGENPDAGNYWRQEEKGMTEDEMVNIRWLNGHEILQAWGGLGGKVVWSWWWTEKPCMLQSLGLQRVGCDWTELNMDKYLYYYPNYHSLQVSCSLTYFLPIFPHSPSAPEG